MNHFGRMPRASSFTAALDPRSPPKPGPERGWLGGVQIANNADPLK